MSHRHFLRHAIPVALALLAVGCQDGTGERTASAPPRLLTLDGRTVDPLRDGGAKVRVFLFTRTDCPISNRYGPQVRRLYERFAGQGVSFRLVYVDPDQGADEIREHIAEFGYPMEALRDPEHALVALTGARVTPEAVVFVPGGRGVRMAYRGRIDDWYVDFGKSRRAPSVRDLEDALDAILAGEPVPRARTRAIGCFIADLS